MRRERPRGGDDDISVTDGGGRDGSTTWLGVGGLLWLVSLVLDESVARTSQGKGKGMDVNHLGSGGR